MHFCIGVGSLEAVFHEITRGKNKAQMIGIAELPCIPSLKEDLLSPYFSSLLVVVPDATVLYIRG
jgi:hypothetical protein